MCNFFSFVLNPKNGKMYFFDAEDRKDVIIRRKYELDSHSSICAHFDLKEDRMNKYEYVSWDNDFVLKEDEIHDRDIHLIDVAVKVKKFAETKKFQDIISVRVNNGDMSLPIKYYTDKMILKHAENLNRYQIKTLPKKFWSNKKFLNRFFNNVNNFSYAPCISQETKNKAIASANTYIFITSYLKKRWGIHA